jgi:hypothetical protein
MIRTTGKPVGYSNLGVCLAGSHSDSGLLTIGNNLLQAQLAVAEKSDKCDKHNHLGLLKDTIDGHNTAS